MMQVGGGAGGAHAPHGLLPGLGGGPGGGPGGVAAAAGGAAATTGGGRKVYECYLEGAVSDPTRHEALLARLVGLCGPAGRQPRGAGDGGEGEEGEEDEEDGNGGGTIPAVLHHREMLFKVPASLVLPPSLPPQQQTQTVSAAAAAMAGMGGPTTPVPTFNDLRVRCNLVPSRRRGGAFASSSSSSAWSVHYISMPLIREKMAANVRNVTDVEVSDNVIDLLRLMGYQFQFEFIREGVVFQTQRKITMAITQIKKVVDKDDPSTAEPLVAGTWFVELSARTDDSNMIPMLCDEINSFADYLMPLVDLKRVDYRRFFAASVTEPPATVSQAKGRLPPHLQRPGAKPGAGPAGGIPPHGRGGGPPPAGLQAGKNPASFITL